MNRKRINSYIHIVGKEFFQVALITYLILVVADTVRAGAVSNFFSLNILLIIVLITGSAMVITEPRKMLNFFTPIVTSKTIRKTPSRIKNPLKKLRSKKTDN